MEKQDEDVEKQSFTTENHDENDENVGPETVRKRLKRYFKILSSKLNVLTPYLIIIIYSIVGALIFMSLEREQDIENRLSKKLDIEAARNSTLLKLSEIFTNGSLNNTESYILDVIINHELSVGFSHSEDTNWNFWNAVLYAGTIYTTIGYGNIFCVTVGGRLMTIFYAIVGIPLVLNTLNDLGKFLMDVIERSSDAFHRIKMKNFRKKRQTTTTAVEEGGDTTEVEPVKVDRWGAVVEQVETEDPEGYQSSESDRDPPVVGAVIMTISWLFICAGTFCIWEDWSYFTSFYFFFVSLSTIGFGDVVPAYPQYMVMNFALVIIGLALVSVCINVVQQSLENMYMALLMALLQDYQRMVDRGENQKGASMGMVKMWSRNKKAKWLLPLLGKDKRNIVMQKFQEEAKAHNIELPPVFTSVDKKTGLPSVVKAAEKEKVEEWVSKIEENQLKFEESQLQQKIAQPKSEDEVTIVESPEELVQTPEPETRQMCSQTSLNDLTESEQQTYSSSFQLREATSQTALSELKNRQMQTALSLFQLREATSQTTIKEQEARAMQTLSSLSLQQDNASQTIMKQFQEQPMQTVSSCLYSKESDSQTSPKLRHSAQAQTYSSFTGTQENLSQTPLSAFAMRNCESQTDIYARNHSGSQTYLSAFRIRDYGGQTEKMNLSEALSQTDLVSPFVATNEFGSQTTLATSEQDVQTEVEQNICASQTDVSSFMLTDNDSQTYLSTTDTSLQHGTSLAELASVGLQATCAQNDSTAQTLLSTFRLRETQSQTTLSTAEDFTQTQLQESNRAECQSQTELNVKEKDNQTAISFFKLRDTDSQTCVNNTDECLQTVYEVDESECQTHAVDTSEASSQIGSEFFRLKQADSQTTLSTEEAVAQTSSSYFDVNHFGSQTLATIVDESQVQTDASSISMVDQTQQACIKESQHDVAVQTGILVRIEHLISRALGKNQEEEQPESTLVAKRKNLRKTHAVQQKEGTVSDDESRHASRRRSSTTTEQEQSSSDEDLDERSEKKEKLTWTPFDGRHVEKQKPVSALKKKFERRPTSKAMGGQTSPRISNRRTSDGSAMK